MYKNEVINPSFKIVKKAPSILNHLILKEITLKRRDFVKKLIPLITVGLLLLLGSNFTYPMFAQEPLVDETLVSKFANYPMSTSKILDNDADFKVMYVDEKGEVKDVTQALKYPVKEMNNRSALAVRDMETLVSAKITWDKAHKLVVVHKNAATKSIIYFPIDRKAYAVNGEVKSMDTSASVHNKYQRTYIPLRYLSEALGFQVQFVAKDSSIWLGPDASMVKEKASQHALNVQPKPTPQPKPAPQPNAGYKEKAAQHFQIIKPNHYTEENIRRKVGRFADWNTDFSPENLVFLYNQIVLKAHRNSHPPSSVEQFKKSPMWKKIQSLGGPNVLNSAQKKYLNDRVEYVNKFPGSVYNITITDKFTGDRYMLDQNGVLMNIDRPGRNVPEYNAVYPNDGSPVYDTVLKEGITTNNRKQAGKLIQRNADINKIFTAFKQNNALSNHPLQPISKPVFNSMDKMEICKVTPTTKFGLAGFNDGRVKGGDTGLEHIFIPVINDAGKLTDTSGELYGTYNKRLGYRLNLSGEITSKSLALGVVFEDGTVKTNQHPLVLWNASPVHGRVRSLVFFNNDPNNTVDTAYYVNYQEYWTGNKTISQISGGLES